MMGRSASRRPESKVVSATSSQVVPASTAVDFGDNPTAAIHANQSGNLTGTLVNDDTPITLVVVQGMIYPLSFKSISSAGNVAVIALFN